MTPVVVDAPAPGGIRTVGRGDLRIDRWTLALAAISAGLVGLGWGLGWRGVDFPAQLYRVEQFRAHGFTLWDSQWYSGHWTLDYSLTYPALGALLGVGQLAVLSAALATAAFDRILRAGFGTAGRLGSTIFALSVIVETSIGQLAFFTGEAFGLACVWALLGARRARANYLLAAVLALATTAASPLAGFFLALAIAAWYLASGWGGAKRLIPIGVLALLPIAIATVLFPGQGPMPYPVTDWLWETVVALLVWAVVPTGMRTLRIGIGLYLLALLGSVSVPTALGGNVGRMEDAFALPIVAACCWSRRDAAATAWPLGRRLDRVPPHAVTRGFRIAMVGLGLPLVLSQWGPAWQALTVNAGRSWTHRGYYAPLDAWLSGELAEPPVARAEVVPTRDHWEADFIASSVPLARGWDRQLDEADDPLFYAEGRLTSQSYLAWLKANGVRYVALAGAPLDSAGVAEARLLRAGVPGLRPVWRTADWRVWEVIGGPGLVSGPARLTGISQGRLGLDATATGPIEVRVRWAAHWHVESGVAHLAEAPGGWTIVAAKRSGPVSLRAGIGV